MHIPFNPVHIYTKCMGGDGSGGYRFNLGQYCTYLAEETSRDRRKESVNGKNSIPSTCERPDPRPGWQQVGALSCNMFKWVGYLSFTAENMS